MSRISKILKTHESIMTLNMKYNRIGPIAGRELGILLKNSKTLVNLDLSYNRLGEMIRYPTLHQQEVIPSAAKDICVGLKSNKSLQILNLIYNYLGEQLADYLGFCLIKHPCLISLNISGNNIGPVKGPILIFSLAGEPHGE